MKIKYFKNPNKIPLFAQQVAIAHIATKGDFFIVFYYEVNNK